MLQSPLVFFSSDYKKLSQSLPSADQQRSGKQLPRKCSFALSLVAKGKGKRLRASLQKKSTCTNTCNEELDHARAGHELPQAPEG